MRPLVLILTLAWSALGQTVPLPRLLNFEGARPGGPPPGWFAPPGTAVIDDKVFHGGAASVRIERRANSDGQFSGISYVLPIDFRAETIELRGYLRSSEVTGGVIAMWLRVDGQAGSLGFNTTQGQGVTGTTDWTEYRLSLLIKPEARRLAFGVLVTGPGTLWADDLQLLADGKPVTDFPRIDAILGTDNEFKSGSGIPPITSLSEVQTQNLATLGKVWGFVKYHHPTVTSGKRQWDFDLFRVLPKILAAKDRASANTAMLQWIDALGEVPACKPCATLSGSDLQIRPDTAWLEDKVQLGAKLSARLHEIYINRSTAYHQLYVEPGPGAGNPNFDHELPYPEIKFPDAGAQILALYRYWNIIRYWFPNRDIIGEDWDNVLADTLPKFALAKDAPAFQSEMLKLIVRINDSHAGLDGSTAQPPSGSCALPVVMRFIGDRAVVSGYSDTETGQGSGLKPGDVITELDGTPMLTLLKEWWPYYSASNDPTRLRNIARNLPRGACGPASLRVQRGAESLALKVERTQPNGRPPGRTHDRPGDTYQRLTPEIGYIKLSSLKNNDIARYLDSAAGTKGLIIDIRNYPADFVVFTLTGRLLDKPAEFVSFTAIDMENPGAFRMSLPLSIPPIAPRYSGKVVILIDEISQSNAEYTTMALRSAPSAKVIGSTTAGADGNVSTIPLPFGLSTRISGLGVFYPDKRPTQRVGIVADIDLKPTVEGIRDGRDELLDAAIQEILK
jgi:C-terminal processing protease CtpA/Prc